MEGISLLRRALEELRAHRVVVESVVLESSGTASRSVGVRMLTFADGSHAGTTGGGAFEYRCQALARETLADGKARCEHIDHGAGELACGGARTVGIRRLGDDDARVLEQALAHLKGGGWGMLAVDWSAGEPIASFTPMEGAGKDALRRGATFGDGCFLEPLFPQDRMVIFGAGHVGGALVRQMALLDFEVLVVDNRPEVAVSALFPEAREVILGDYADIAASVKLTSRDFVCVTTSTHATDIAVLGQALAVGPRYLGCLGSERKRATVRERLAAQGFTEEQLDSIDLPMGIPLGDVTPAEVAVSAAARVIGVRRG